MMIWFLTTLLGLGTVAALLIPLLKRDAGVSAARADYDKAVFKDQLAEVEREVARGMLSGPEADAARNEISRRLLQAADMASTAPHASSRLLLPLVAALAVPLVAGAIYLSFGQPGQPDAPRAERMANAQATGDLDALLAQIEDHLRAKPDDLKGWEVVAPVYRRAERWQDAANAYGNILRLAPPSAMTLSDYAEMLVLANQGVVTPDAEKAFKQALVIDAKEPKARFFVAIALKQQGKADEAKAALQQLLADAPTDAPWRDMVQNALSETAAPAGNPVPADQADMIRGMVEGLDAKLRDNPDNLEGWLRLIRARSVLGELEKAKAALATARQTFANKPEALGPIDALAKELNLL